MSHKTSYRFAPKDAAHEASSSTACDDKINGYEEPSFDEESGFIDSEIEGGNIGIKKASDCTSTSFSEIEEVNDEDDHTASLGATSANNKVINERLDLIKEEEISWLLPNEGSGDQDIYVAVGKSETSMGALVWALNNAVNPFTSTLYLIHVFPELKWVPNPLGHGKVPRSQVRKEALDEYLAEETRKRRQLLNKFMDKCNVLKVKVDTILIESDMVAKAILELIKVLNIQRLVIGVPKSNLRKLRSRKGNGIPDQILGKAPEWCEVKCICEGKDAFEESPKAQTPVASPCAANENGQTTRTPSPNVDSSNVGVENQLSQPQRRDNPSFCCFKA